MESQLGDSMYLLADDLEPGHLGACNFNSDIGLFDPTKVRKLHRRLCDGLNIGPAEHCMALV